MFLNLKSFHITSKDTILAIYSQKQIVGAAEMPDAMEIIFQSALSIGTNGAVSSLILFTFKFSSKLVIFLKDHIRCKKVIMFLCF